LVHLGPNGAGQTIKLAMNLILAFASRRARGSAGASHWRGAERRGLGGSDAIEHGALRRAGREGAEPSERRVQAQLSAAANAQRFELGAGLGQPDRRGLARDRRGA